MGTFYGYGTYVTPPPQNCRGCGKEFGDWDVEEAMQKAYIALSQANKLKAENGFIIGDVNSNYLMKDE